MIALVTGGSGSGKSAYAESLAVALFTSAGHAAPVPSALARSGAMAPSASCGSAAPGARPDGRLLYLATMRRSRDEEVLRRIARHRAMRAGKGFLTVERERTLSLEEKSFTGRDTILLEDLSNLLTNELYAGPEIADPEAMTDREILAPLRRISDAGNTLVIVTNEIGWDVPSRYEEARRFVRLFGRLNCQLAAEAALAAEVTAGVPVILKKERETGCLNL